MRSPDAQAARRVESEWLDHLPPHDARAVRSRRDLVRVNALMANGGIVTDALRARLRPGALRLAEVGCGDAAFALRVVRRLGRRAGAITLLDRASLDGRECRAAFHDAGWEASAVTADVFDWLEDPATPRFDAIFANLFLHHFEPRPLARMLRLIAARTQLFVACEPRRSRTALMGSRLLGLAGCNDVTRHDAVVSVRAGFSASELSDLWAVDAGWSLDERPRGLFSHCFVAERL